MDQIESEYGFSAKYVRKGLEIVETAKKEGIELRLLGAVAVKIQSPKLRKFHEDMMDRQATDLDFIAYSKDRNKIKKLFEKMKYTPIKTVLPMENRDLFIENDGIKVDVFYDKLAMCHAIDFTHRLEVDYPIISIADIILEKTQIVKINEKDIKDLIILFAEHELAGSDDNRMINSSYISKLLAKDWGFYYTVTTNLKLVRDQFLGKWKDASAQEYLDQVGPRIEKLLLQIEAEPKSMGWKMRQSVGTKKKWYKDVEEVCGDSEFQDKLQDLLKNSK
jgi:hypothetical protein